jgi:hypothetical protein
MSTSILSISGKVIYSGNEATLSAAISNAISTGISLRGANLSDANLAEANLSGSDLRNAHLYYAVLCRVDFSYANLRGADLSFANLSDADLSGANLSGADFRFSTGLYIPGVARSMQLHYKIILIGDSLFIGCRHHKLHEWFSFSDETINKMDDGALKWWRENKAMLHAWSEAEDFGIEL